MSDDKHVDESWKDAVAQEKDNADGCAEGCSCGDHHHEHGEGEDVEVNFFTYLTSLGYQAMIFLGEVPNPMTGQTEKNLRQAKFLIDTLILIREKTKGNLTPQEESFLGGTIYELETRFVEEQRRING